MEAHAILESINLEEVPPELLEELEREITRNLEATKMVRERERQALEARGRAAHSQKRMQEMMDRYDEMQRKLDWTRLTLAETNSLIAIHSDQREANIKNSVSSLKQRAESYSEKLKERQRAIDEGREDPHPTMNAVFEDDGGLTDAERMLLQMCQEQQQEQQKEQQQQKQQQTEETNSVQSKPKSRDYAQTVLDIQKKFASKHVSQPEKKESHESSKVTSIPEEPAEPAVATQEPEAPAAEKTEPEPEVEECQPQPTAEVDFEDLFPPELSFSTAEDPSSSSPSTSDHDSRAAKVAALADEVDEVVAMAEVTMDLNQAVEKIEAKVAGVREELGQMAMSEQYMRTKQAQLLARQREKQAQISLAIAMEKEKEAVEMRRKVEQMALLLEERRNKLKMTENVLVKKTNVVDKVNKILESKHRKAEYVQKQTMECAMFDQKPKK